MGIYDRDYERDDHWRGDRGGGFNGGGVQLQMPRSVVGRVVLVTVLAYVVELMFENRATGQNSLIDWFGLHADWWQRPWQVYQLLTCALLHAPEDIMHVVFNMFGFWLFGRELEAKYGSREFLLIYLAAILCGSLAFTFAELGVADPDGRAKLAIGASGGTVAIIILNALLYPHKTILFMFFIPMPMWVLGIILVAGDIHGALGFSNSPIAFMCHLGGAAFVAVYYFQGWRLSEWVPQEIRFPSLKRKPKLRVHHGYDDPPEEQENKLDAEVDRLLAKIKEHGANSLSAKEKRILERASREYQGRRRL